MSEERTRLYVFAAFLGALLVAWAIGLGNDVRQIERLRDGCERQNPRTLALYQNTIRDADSRRAAAPQLGDEFEQLARDGYRDAREIKRAIQDVAVAPGSVISDCEKSYPQPFPLNLLEDE